MRVWMRRSAMPALTDFYDSLTDEQKARFNVIGPASPAAAPQVETKSGG
jgi:hypothetical protein